LLTNPSGKKTALEIKFSSVPAVTKGFYNSPENLKPDHAFVLTPESTPYAKPGDVQVCSLEDFLEKELPVLAS